MKWIAVFFAACTVAISVWLWIDIRSPKNKPDLG